MAYEVRLKNRINQNQLADLCSVQQSCVSKWKRGLTLPDGEMTVVLCRALDVSSDYLLGIEDYEF